MWDLFLWLLATHKTFAASSSSPVYMWLSLHPRLFPPADTGSGRRAASLWLCGEAGKHRPWRSKHLTSVPAWEHLALPGSQDPPSVWLSDCQPTHTVGVHWCCHGTRIFYAYTGTGLINKSDHNSTYTKAKRPNVTELSYILWLSHYKISSLVCIINKKALIFWYVNAVRHPQAKGLWCHF